MSTDSHDNCGLCRMEQQDEYYRQLGEMVIRMPKGWRLCHDSMNARNMQWYVMDWMFGEILGHGTTPNDALAQALAARERGGEQ